MRLLIVGGSGMLGHKLFQKLGAIYPETFCTIRKDVMVSPLSNIPFFQTDKVIQNIDVTDFSGLQAVVEEIRPDYILNCVGIIKQRKDDLTAIPCITLNALLPHKLAELASSVGGRVIHFSTDCVFDGKRGMYTEDDIPNAPDMYGRTKTLGEIQYDHTLTLRSSIIGRELGGHSSLLDWFLMQNGKSTKGFTNAIYSGVTTNQMAKVIQMVIENYPSLHGLYQVVAEPINKYDLLCLAREVFGLQIEINPYDDFYMDRSMKGDRFETATGYRSPSWPALLEELADESALYKSWGINL